MYDYLRPESTPEKQKQNALAKLSGYMNRKLTHKVLDLLDYL